MGIHRVILGGLLFGAMAFGVCEAHAQRLTREEYIQKYKRLALEEQEIYGIPASITMAQALCESEHGNSRLAREANNHFGIKCKKSWTGPTIRHDDDAPDECFRKYASVEESFRDHSEFLDKSERYQDLFKLDPTDYKGWAHGLKKAGYATNPRYAEQLIAIVEEFDLHRLDIGQDITPGGLVAVEEKRESQPVTVPVAVVDIDDYVIAATKVNGYPVYTNNGSEFVVAAKGDGLPQIASKFRIKEKRLRKFNDLAAGADIAEGDMVYLKMKNKRSSNGKLTHYAKEGETLHGISQLYGIRLKNLEKLNGRSADMPLMAGQQIRLM